MSRAVRKVDEIVVQGARTVTRRRFLRNAGASAFGVALATTFFGARPYAAHASHVNTICGPSPYCRQSRCSGYRCHNTDRTRWRAYNGNKCGSSRTKNCWTTCRNGAKYRCCDCCADRYQSDMLSQRGHPRGPRCYGCPGSARWYTCICRGQSIGSC